MTASYSAVIKRDGDWWIGWIQEIQGVNCQETSRENLRENLRNALLEALELNRQQALTAAGSDYQEEVVQL